MYYTCFSVIIQWVKIKIFCATKWKQYVNLFFPLLLKILYYYAVIKLTTACKYFIIYTFEHYNGIFQKNTNCIAVHKVLVPIKQFLKVLYTQMLHLKIIIDDSEVKYQNITYIKLLSLMKHFK